MAVEGNLGQAMRQAMTFHQQGRLAEAEQIYRWVDSRRPGQIQVLHFLGLLKLQQGDPRQALDLLGAAAKLDPRDADLLTAQGAALAALGRHEEALAVYDGLVRQRPADAEARYNRAVMLSQLARHNEALEAYDGALAIRPDHAASLFNRGNVLALFERYGEALESYDKAITLAPRHVDTLNNRGNVLTKLGRHAEALKAYERVLTLVPDHVHALNNRGNALKALGRYEEALESYDRALVAKPDHAAALNNRGNALFELKRYEDAVASLEAARLLSPQDPDVLFNLDRAGQFARAEAALAVIDRQLTAAPEDADLWYRRGETLGKLQRIPEAIAAHEKVLAIAPDHPRAYDALLGWQAGTCNWGEVARLADELSSRLEKQQSIIEPFKLLRLPVTDAMRLQAARNHVRHKTRDLHIRHAAGNEAADCFPSSEERAVPREARNRVGSPHPARAFGPGHPPLQAGINRDKIRIAYLSADFRLHATSMLIRGLFELHDRSHFEVLAVSFGPDDHSEMRSRVIASVDQFHDVSSQDAAAIAERMRELKVDIAVDLMGHTRHARTEILAHRPAPLQASYLGYPGTMGADFIDYVIADRVVLPFAEQRFYDEAIVHLPHCYQANDSKRSIARAPSRGEFGLPEQALVFCCFNNSSKITAQFFDIWMRLLGRVEGSVLWLLKTDGVTLGNLRREAGARGIDPSRLIFADMVTPERHLARHALADLFLDTLPYNAHTTGSDALWADLPIVTCTGDAFAGRVGASLLRAAGIPELVTGSIEEYEALALALVTDPARRQAIRRKLAANRTTCPLFDTDRFRRHIEAAYTTMWDLYRRGEKPKSFAVEPIA